MRLTPTERDRLLLFGAAELARTRRARGLRLNVPEATALIADTVCEAARDGRRLSEAIEAARSVLGPDDVLPGVADVVTEVHVEAVFDDGSRLAVVSDPIRGATADGRPAGLGDAAPGAVLPGPADPAPTPRVRLTVRNTATVPVSVTSHFHFFEANPRLEFDRAAAYGMRLCIPAGSSQRFDPGAVAEVGLVPIGGDRVAIGFAGLVDGPLDAPGARAEALRRAAACGYLGAVPDAGAAPGGGTPARTRADDGTSGAAAPGGGRPGRAAPEGPAGTPAEGRDEEGRR
ncbi:urease subunit gamma [Streptomyces pactum]|uniref:urease n=1 Tax=Streptomyces pactum TaxID=68249 RepID=A0ABS0NPP2_9ACTN|nr:urease subunit gamma [Streptomyces pactum]MBH5337167.1 urease subunit gamma [Streptomyces pactum]